MELDEKKKLIGKVIVIVLCCIQLFYAFQFLDSIIQDSRGWENPIVYYIIIFGYILLIMGLTIGVYKGKNWARISMAIKMIIVILFSLYGTKYELDFIRREHIVDKNLFYCYMQIKNICIRVIFNVIGIYFMLFNKTVKSLSLQKNKKNPVSEHTKTEMTTSTIDYMSEKKRLIGKIIVILLCCIQLFFCFQNLDEKIYRCVFYHKNIELYLVIFLDVLALIIGFSIGVYKGQKWARILMSILMIGFIIFLIYQIKKDYQWIINNTNTANYKLINLGYVIDIKNYILKILVLIVGIYFMLFSKTAKLIKN